MSGESTAVGRRSTLAEARALGSHTDAEWASLVRSSSKECPYCGVELNVFNDAKDHRMPLALGGSDGIDNLQRICWECNASKGALPPESYVYDGQWPRPFRPSPTREREYEAVMARARR